MDPTLSNEPRPAARIARRLGAATLHGSLILVAIVFFMGRGSGGLMTTLAGPWVLQCWIALLVIVGIALLTMRWKTTALASTLLIWSSFIVVPTLLPRPDAQASSLPALPIRVLEANVKVTNPPTLDSVGWMRAEKPDLLVIIELSTAWEEALASFSDELPYIVTRTADRGGGGLGLYSRFPLRDSRFGVAFVGTHRHIQTIVEHPLGDIRLFVVHPLSPTNDERAKLRDAELSWIAARCATSDMPTLVVGDFNETPYGPAFAKFLKRTGYEPARDVGGFTPTWPAFIGRQPVPLLFRIPIDHCVVSRHFSTTSFRVGPDIGSDHIPIVADLLFEPQRSVTAFPPRSGLPEGR